MNQHIFELIQQQNGNCGLVWSEEDKEKFAELIVQECADIADKNSPLSFPDHGIKIKQHFGVEQ